jgi:rifampicin phosphotransferase
MTAAVDFPIAWDDPADAELEWERDDMHMPFAVTPLSADYVRVLFEGMAYGRAKIQNPWEILLRFWHGFVYLTARPFAPIPDEAAAIEALTERKRALIATTEAYWRDEAMPELRALRDWFRRVAVEDGRPAELVEDWRTAWTLVARAWGIHFYAIRGPYQIVDDLSDLYESVVPDAPPGEALRLIQGRAGVLHDVERGLDRLTAIVVAEPTLRARFDGAAPPAMDELDDAPEAGEFVTALRAFLDEHGHLGGSFDDLAFPSWSEAPEIVLGDIARRMANGGPSADERQAALLAGAEELADAVRDRLRARPDDLSRFERLLADARSVGPLTEIHNYWIDRLVQACIRRFALRVGERLAETGVIEAGPDILYLTRDEVEDLLRAPADRTGTVAERRATHAHQAKMTAPRYAANAPPKDAETDRFDGARFEPDVDGRLRGTGASAGIARGTARVILGPQDFGRVRPGDVIVAPSSNPSWVPLFTIAGGLLTNTGGVVCHAAVVAREFGLPAVVGLGDATTRIPDGATVELDGTTGYVRIL